MLSHFFPVADAHSRMRLQCVAALLSLYSERDSWGANSPYNIGYNRLLDTFGKYCIHNCYVGNRV